MWYEKLRKALAKKAYQLASLDNARTQEDLIEEAILYMYEKIGKNLDVEKKNTYIDRNIGYAYRICLQYFTNYIREINAERRGGDGIGQDKKNDLLLLIFAYNDYVEKKRVYHAI